MDRALTLSLILTHARDFDLTLTWDLDLTLTSSWILTRILFLILSSTSTLTQI
jgi:hypothetical protein